MLNWLPHLIVNDKTGADEQSDSDKTTNDNESGYPRDETRTSDVKLPSKFLHLDVMTIFGTEQTNSFEMKNGGCIFKRL